MDNCTWDNPGAAPFRGGNVSAAVHSYNFPESAAEEIVRKISTGRDDAIVFITRDSVIAPFGTVSKLEDMHYSKGKKYSGEVLRSKWSDNRKEAAFVYCATGTPYCVAVPVVCGNISKISYVPNGTPQWPHSGNHNQLYPDSHEKVPMPISTPSTAWLVAAGLFSLYVYKRVNKK